MATNNELPSAVEKRTRFFDGQFLQDQDFVDEQSYHLDRQRRHNRLLHVSGIAEGLNVTAPGENRVRVSEGTAIDIDGRQLVLARSTTVELPAERFNNTMGIDLYISYQQSPEDRQTTEGSEDFTRWLERPLLQAVAPGASFEGETPPMLLAKLDVDGGGRVAVDESVRTYSGVRLPGASGDASSLRATPSGEVSLIGGLTISRGKLRLDTDQQLVFTDGDASNNLKLQLWDGYGIGINPSTLFYAADGRHSWRDRNGETERMWLSTAEEGGLHVLGAGYSQFAGPIWADAKVDCEQLNVRGDATSSFNGPLTVHTAMTAGSVITQYLFVNRPAWHDTGGNQLLVALVQEDTDPPKVPDVNPSILFEHRNRYRHRIEARRDGIHFNTGDYFNDIHTSIVAGDVFVKGQIYNQSDAATEEGRGRDLRCADASGSAAWRALRLERRGSGKSFP